MHSMERLFNEGPRSKLRGILKQSQLVTLMQNCIFFLNPLIKDVSRNTSLIPKLDNHVDKVPICPELSTPKLCFDIWMEPEYFTCSNAFQHLDDLCRTFHRN